jgi:hypothetical protein
VHRSAGEICDVSGGSAGTGVAAKRTADLGSDRGVSYVDGTTVYVTYQNDLFRVSP